jgi:membrane protein implicated in regulation of membrane protease activity
VFLIVAIVVLLLVPSPWNLVGFAIGLVVFVCELLLWRRKVRGVRKEVGVETLIGREARVVTACRPDGQVRLGGETWAARCSEGADVGEAVTIVGLAELTLTVSAVAGSR